MCWNIIVSLSAALLHAVTFFVANNKRVPEWKSYLLFTVFFLSMEVFQAGQWWIGDVSVGCTDRNRLMTHIAYFLISVQPLLFVSIGQKRQFHTVQVRLQYARRLAIFIAFYALTNLFLGQLTHPTYFLPESSFATETCTMVGPNGHLAWNFSPLTIVYGPTHFVYVASILMTISFYSRALFVTIGAGWITTLFVSIYLVGLGAELPAFWCLLSVFVDIPILIRIIFY